MKTDIINARVAPGLKRSAERIFKSLGMTMTEAISIFLSQVVLNKGLPFPVRVPNAVTRQAIKRAKEGKGKRYHSVQELVDDLGK